MISFVVGVTVFFAVIGVSRVAEDVTVWFAKNFS